MFFTLFSSRMISFLPFSVNCSQAAMFQIVPALCPHGQGEGGGGDGRPNVDRPGQGQGVSQKFPDLCGHPLWMTPITKAIFVKQTDLLSIILPSIQISVISLCNYYQFSSLSCGLLIVFLKKG